MYTREVTSAPEKIIQAGRPVFGTFNTLPQKLDIKGVAAPFGGIPFPASLTRLKIRARAIIVFIMGDYLGAVDIFDNKIINMAEASFFNTRTGKKYIYRTFLLPRKRLIPTNLSKGACIVSPSRRHIRLLWDHEKDSLSLKINVWGDAHRPDVNVSIKGHFSAQHSKEVVTVKPAPTQRRCSATWYSTLPINGKVSFEGVAEKADIHDNGSAILFLNRSYYKFRTRGENITAIGSIKGQMVSFRFSTTTLDAVNTDAYNDNVLFVDGIFTPMPQVYITHPFGINKNWVIQDVQSMVDLEFTPVASVSRSLNLIVINSAYDTVFGMLNGALWDLNGTKIVIKDFPAIARRSMLRG